MEQSIRAKGVTDLQPRPNNRSQAHHAQKSPEQSRFKSVEAHHESDANARTTHSKAKGLGRAALARTSWIRCGALGRRCPSQRGGRRRGARGWSACGRWRSDPRTSPLSPLSPHNGGMAGRARVGDTEWRAAERRKGKRPRGGLRDEAMDAEFSPLRTPTYSLEIIHT
jgi:hypothetical protein